MNSRRQRYFRARSPSGREMEVLEQGEIVMERDAAGEEQHVSHEEIVDDGNSEMTMEHLRQPPQPQQQQQQQQAQPQQIHYEERSYNSAPAPPRRPGRPGQRYTNQHLPVDVIQKLQNKNMYMGVQRQGPPAQQSRISPGGARIVSLPIGARKREAGEGNGMVIKRQIQQQQFRSQMIQNASSQSSQQPPSQQSHNNSANNKNVKVVRVVSNATSIRNNPAIAEQHIAEIEERIKQTIEDTKVDMQKIKELQEQEMSPDEYHQLLGWLFGEIDRLNGANTSLNDFYRQRQRDEKSVFEARTDALNARIRQLETENRKLRENVMIMHQTRFEQFDTNIIRHEQVQQDDEHMGQIMEETEEVAHLEAKEEVPPEWIVEETVDMQDGTQDKQFVNE